MGNTSLENTEFASIVTAITGAFGDPTRREIYLYVREHEEGTNASQIAEVFNLHPNVARHHLDKLLSGGYLEVSLQKNTGWSAGRPSKTYKISNPQKPLNIDVRRDSILISLLARTLSLLPTEEAEMLAEEVGSEVGRSMAESLGIKDVVAKSTGSSNPHNMIKATFDAFKKSESPKSVAAKRTIKISKVNSNKTAS